MTTDKSQNFASIRALLTEPIPMPDGGRYLGSIPTQLQTAFKANFGGTFTAAQIKTMAAATGFSGIMSWFCLDTSNSMAPKLFLALQNMINFTPPQTEATALALRPNVGKLIVPTHLFPHDFTSTPDHEVYLRQHVMTPPSADGQIDSGDVFPLVTAYLQNPLVKPHQKYGWGYFENNDRLIKRFLDQADVRFVRYYFGYNSTLGPNKIRVVLVPVDAQGRNITTQANGTPVMLLQKSVPPPPIL